jgi:outer membrane receptor protein involved in Fe transport
MDLAEVGYKFASDFVELYPTIFYTKYNNVAFTNYVFSPSGSSTPEYLYANTKTIGLELDGIVRFSPMLDLGFVVTTEDPLYDNFAYTTSSKQSINYSGNQLIRVPRTSYRLVPGINLFGDRLRIQASYEYVGSRFVDVANSVMLPDYRVTNLAARYNIDKSMTFLLNIDNLNNSMGLTEGNPRAGEVQSADAYANSFIARPIIGRNIRVSLKYDF